MSLILRVNECSFEIVCQRRWTFGGLDTIWTHRAGEQSMPLVEHHVFCTYRGFPLYRTGLTYMYNAFWPWIGAARDVFCWQVVVAMRSMNSIENPIVQAVGIACFPLRTVKQAIRKTLFWDLRAPSHKLRHISLALMACWDTRWRSIILAWRSLWFCWKYVIIWQDVVNVFLPVCPELWIVKTQCAVLVLERQLFRSYMAISGRTCCRPQVARLIGVFDRKSFDSANVSKQDFSSPISQPNFYNQEFYFHQRERIK